MLVTCVDGGSPDLADDHFLGFRVAILIDFVFGIADFHQML